MTSPSLQFIQLVAGNHHVSIGVGVLEGLEGLQVLRHLLQTNLQQQLTFQSKEPNNLLQRSC